MAKDDPARRDRLKAALRDNLRRRKVQAREQARTPDARPASEAKEPAAD